MKAMIEKLKELSPAQKAVLAIVLPLVCAIFWAVSSVPALPDKKAAEELVHKAKIMVYENNTMREEQNGRVIWEIKARRTEMNGETKSATCEGITGRFYREDGTVVTGRARGGGYDGKTKDVFLVGEAVIETDDGRKLTADKITWNASEQKAVAEGRAHLTKK